jgi:Flp pilus assembly protein TadG
MRFRIISKARRGTTLVESAVVLLTLLTLLLGMIDLAMAVERFHITTEAARQGARLAIVHGNTDPPSGVTKDKWDPSSGYPAQNPYTVAGTNSSDKIVNKMLPYFAGIDPSTVNITVYWVDGTNDPGNRVRVTVTSTWTPMFGFILGTTQATLTGKSTMVIAY